MITTSLLWIVMWTMGWLGFFVLNKKKIDYLNRHTISIIYFLGVSLLIVFIYRQDFFSLFTNELSIVPFVSVALLVAGNVIAYKYIRTNFTRPDELIDNNPKIFFLKLENKYLASKSFEILFQQILIILLVLWLSNLGMSVFEIVAGFAILFGLSHCYLIFSLGKLFGTIFTVSSILSAIIFPILIVYVPWGFMYSYGVHWLFYISIGYFFWRKKLANEYQTSPQIK